MPIFIQKDNPQTLKSVGCLDTGAHTRIMYTLSQKEIES